MLAVRNYTHGYVILTKAGAVPVPHRWFDGGTAPRLRALIARYRSAQGATPMTPAVSGADARR